MANPATLYRFKIELSDIDRSVYEALDLRVALHPSETESSLLTRVLAYALNYQDGLELSQGISDPDEPAMRVLDVNGGIALWIDIGNPSPRRVHKASKAARKVRIYTYKDPEQLKREAQAEQVHKASEIEVFALEPSFLKGLGGLLARDNSWNVLYQDGELTVTQGKETLVGALAAHRLA